MSIELTPQGKQAQQIVDWAWDQPAERAAEGLRRISALAATAEGQALIEIQDAGTMLARLAGATIQPETISSQVAR